MTHAPRSVSRVKFDLSLTLLAFFLNSVSFKNSPDDRVALVYTSFTLDS